MQRHLSVEVVGPIIIARIQREPDAELLRECHDQVLRLVKETSSGKVLYDALEMESPSVDVPLIQWKLDKELGSLRLRRAIVVPNSRLAYLARIAFGEEDCQVFYNDLVSAITWLGEEVDVVQKGK